MRPVLFPFCHSSLAYVETAPSVSASAGIPPFVRYAETASTSDPTFLTASATSGRERATLSVQTALSAVAVVLADPVTVIPLSVRAANPAPTFTSPPPTASAIISDAAITVIERDFSPELFMLMCLS